MTDAEIPKDAAWVSIETPFTREQLKTFLTDTERLFRINSMFEFQGWHPIGPDRFRVQARNLSNGRIWQTELTREETGDGIGVSYSDGLKRSTTFRIEPGAEGARLVILDDYSGTPETERQSRLDEVDRSLPQWGYDLLSYMRSWRRWSWFGPWRWYTVRVWQNMKPSGRRIARWLIWITIAEFVAFLMVFTIFRLEMNV